MFGSFGSSLHKNFPEILHLLLEDKLPNKHLFIFNIQGAWVLRPRESPPTSVVHFIGGIFVGAAPQLTYRLFLERLAEK